MIVFLFLLLLASVTLPALYYNRGERTAKRGKRALMGNILAFTATVLVCSAYIFSGQAHAAEPGGAGLAEAAAYIGAALVTGMACIGAGIAVGSSATAAIGAVSENEKVMGKAIIFVAMAEGIAIYGLLISFMILGRV